MKTREIFLFAVLIIWAFWPKKTRKTFTLDPVVITLDHDDA